MNSDEVLVIENLSKKFCRNLKKGMVYAGKDLISGTFNLNSKSHELRPYEFWALQDINLRLKRGDSVSLIGKNGSGKSTLLRLIAGLYPPDKGELKIRGSVASMIAVGAGFHAYMTGRENIYLNAAILGMEKSYVDKVFDEIVDFAEVENFLDSPVATYSSGMRVRLGFAIASSSRPDLLLLDEILAVGDRQFKVKCYNRIAKLKQDCAVVFVSHNMSEIQRVTSRSLFLEDGKVLYRGPVETAIEKYLERNQLEDGNNAFVKSADFIKFDDIEVDSSDMGWKGKIKLGCQFNSEKDYGDCLIRITFHDEEGRDIANWQSKYHDVSYDIKKGSNQFAVNIENIPLKTGEYKLSYVISSIDETEYLLVAHEFKKLFINSVSGYANFQL